MFKLVEDLVIPQSDELAEAVYKSTKLDYFLRGVKDDTTAVSDGNGLLVLQNTANNESSVKTEKSSDETPGSETQNNDVISRWKLKRVIAGAHEGWVRALDVDPVTNKWFVTGASDSTIKVWDLAQLTCKAVITGHIMAVRALTVSKKFPYLFSGSEDKEVKCFDLERSNSTLGCEIRNYHGHLGGVYATALHPELDILFTGGRDTVVRVWDIRSRAEIMTLTGHRGDITSLITSEIDPQVVSSSTDGTIRLWDIRKQTTELTLTHHLASIRLLVEHPTESTFCTGDSLGSIKQWLLPQGDLLNEFHTYKTNIINTMAVNHTNNHLFAGYDNGEFEIFDYVSGKVLQRLKTIPSPGSNELSINCSAFDKLGLRLITGENDHSVKIWGEDVE